MEGILVSIHCMTYNHKNLVKKALDGFLMQKTDFKYEILVHDDASTDGTQEIIKEYHKNYPEIIKPIYQKVNQYSKGVKVGHLNRLRAKGDYIAYCEGDDYWTDEYKLQKQIDIMQSHPECVMCAHAAYKVDSITNDVVGEIRPLRFSGYLNETDIILSSGNYIPTSSYLVKADIGRKFETFQNMISAGDYCLNLLAIYFGKIYYIDEFMSVYHVNVKGSHNYNAKRKDDMLKIDSANKRIEMLIEFNRFSDERFSSVINEKIKNLEFRVHCLNADRDNIKDIRYKELYLQLTRLQKFKLFIKSITPGFYKTVKRIMNK